MSATVQQYFYLQREREKSALDHKNGRFGGRPGRCVLFDGDGEVKGNFVISFIFCLKKKNDLRNKS